MGHFYNPPPPFIGGSQPLDKGNKVVAPIAANLARHPGRTVAIAETIALSQPDPWVYAFEGGSQPYAPRPLNPAFEAVEVDPPTPNANWVANLYAVRSTWEIQPPQPTLRNANNGLFAVRVDNPIPDLNALSTFHAIRGAWEPPPPQPTLLPPVNASIENNPPSNPVPNANWLANVAAIRSTWEPVPPLPTLNKGVPTGIAVTPAGPSNWLAQTSLITIRSAWEPPPPQPTLRPPLNPFFEAVEVDAPQPNTWLTNFYSIRSAWEPPPPLPTLKAPLPQGTPRDSPQPGATRLVNLYSIIRAAWEPPPPQPTLRNVNNVLFAVRVDNPPFRWLPSSGQIVRGAPVFVQLQGSFNATTVTIPPPQPTPTPVNLETILASWVAPAPPPVQRGPLNPSITAVPVNNPPLGVFTTSASCVFAWYKQPPDPLPSLNRKIFPFTAFQPWVNPSLQAAAASAWGPPAPLPQLPRNLNPVFTGVIPARVFPPPAVLPQYLQHSIGEMFTDYNFANRIAGIATYYGFDLTHDLLHNEKVISTSWQCIVVSGTDPNAASCLSGPSFMQGNISMQLVIGGVSGVTYQLLATITTSFNNVFYRWSNAPCM